MEAGGVVAVVVTVGGVRGGGVVDVRLAVGPRRVGDGRPCQIHDVEGHEGGLEQAGGGHVLLDLGQDGDDRHDHAQQHVEGDEELVDLAVTGGSPWGIVTLLVTLILVTK